MDSLQKRIGHQFADPFLLETALTHRSYGAPNNERLEFIGDAVLSCAIADLLYRKFAELSEGDLSRLRANMVRQETLYRLALELRIGELLHLGDGELKSGGHSRPSILADALEALFGAVYLDQGFPAALSVISGLYSGLVGDIDLSKAIKDSKTRLQEYLQGRRISLPEYEISGAAGEQHSQEFLVTCRIPKLDIVTQATGSSRRVAEQVAAERALVEIEAQDKQKTAGGRS